MYLLGRLSNPWRANQMNMKIRKKTSSDLVIDKSVELFGFTPEEKSDENLKWMREHGYRIKRDKNGRWGARGRRR